MGQRTSFSSTQSKANLPMKGWSSHKTLTQLYPLPFYGQLPKPCPWIPLPHGFQQSWLWTLLLVRGAAPAYTLGLGKLRGASYALLAASQSERDPPHHCSHLHINNTRGVGAEEVTGHQDLDAQFRNCPSISSAPPSPEAVRFFWRSQKRPWLAPCPLEILWGEASQFW